MKKNGFTLIELLAVIIVLTIIALIATPVIINVINSAKDKSDLESVHGILDSARLYYSESMMDNDKKNDIENLNNIYEEVSLSVKEKTGELYINEKGLSAIAVVIRNKCYTKQFSGNIQISEDTTNCTLGYVGIDTTAPTVSFSVLGGTFNSNGWAKNNFNVSITISDNESGPSSYKYCIDTKDCEPIALVNNVTGFSEINKESETNKVCVIGIDNYGNESSIICSDNYKLDKTNPTIAVNNISINKNITIDLNSDVTTSDNLSGVDNYTYDPANIDTSVAGTKTVTYTVRDLAGNSTSIDRTITVITDKPSIAYSTLTSPDGNGWFNSGFYIKAIATPDTTSSINNILWCSTTSDYCEPGSIVNDNNITAYITNNSTTNKVCVKAIDATNNSSNVICSSNYKLDSIAPTIPTIVYNGGSNTDGWKNNYNLTITSSDNLSGVLKYQIDANNDGIVDNETGPSFIPWNGYASGVNRFRAVDNVGNVSVWTDYQKIYMDTEKPVHTNWWWGTATSNGASLYVQTTDNVGIQRVQCPTSTETGGYNNWHWFDATWDTGANAYRCDITSSTFGHYGNYLTHLYIYDYAGNGGYYNQTTINIKKPILANNSVAPVNYTTGSDTRSREIFAYMVKSDGTLWYESRGYNPGLFQVGGISDVVGVSNVQYTTGSDTRSREILAYIVKSDGTLWYESRGYNPGLFQVGGISDVVGVSNVQYTTGSSTRSSKVLAYVVKSDGTLWYESSGYNSGWFQVGGISDVVGVSNVQYTTGSSTRSSEVRAYAVKSDGTLWYESSGYNSGWFQTGSNILH